MALHKQPLDYRAKPTPELNEHPLEMHMAPESMRSRTNNWDVVDLNSIQGVFVDESIGTSISS